MKNIFLLILVAWSTIAFTQKEKAQVFKSAPSSDLINSRQTSLEEQGLEASLPGTGTDFRNPTLGYQEMITPPIQSYDSIVFWKWDAFIYDWTLNSRHVDFKLLSGNKLLSYKAQLWDGIAWKDNFLFTNEYDTNGYLIYAETMRWSDDKWTNYSMTTYTYNDSNKIERILSKGWNGTDWINTEQKNYVYDDKNNPVIFYSQYWSGNTWNNLTQHLSNYDDDNNEVNVTIQNGDGNLWVNSGFVTSRYDTLGNLIFDSIQVWEVDSWVNSALYQIEFSSTNKRLSQHSQNWVNGEWVESQYVTYHYNGIDSLENLLVEKWMNDNWVIDWERIYSYDDNDDLIKTNTNLWRANEWIPLNLRRYTYDKNHFQKSSVLLRFDAEGTLYVSGDSTHYYFSILSASNDLASEDERLKVYPNPSTGKFSISHTNAESVEVFNVNGERVYAKIFEKDQASFQIDMGQCLPGIYFIKLQEGRQSFCRKIVVQ